MEAKRPLLLWRKDKRLQSQPLELERQILTFSRVDGQRGGKLGGGAQGDVFRAWTMSPELPVAVKVSEVGKVYSQCADPDICEDDPAFEAFLMGKVTHDNVV